MFSTVVLPFSYPYQCDSPEEQEQNNKLKNTEHNSLWSQLVLGGDQYAQNHP